MRRVFPLRDICRAACFVVQNYRKLFNRPNYTYNYIRHFLFFLMSCGLWNTFCLFLISFSHRYTFHSACRHDIPLPRHLSLPALIPSSPRLHGRQRRQHHLSLPALIPLSPPSARQTAETALSQSPCSHPLVPLLANEACTKQIRHASLSYSLPGYSSVFYCHIGCTWFIYRYSPKRFT